ncbi:MAG TPA: RecX family transcriptional regulator [Abditibacteriaceae bacterium]|nr:RecX family transcriptional regulator [Abditibacteriaceae bacterium]
MPNQPHTGTITSVVAQAKTRRHLGARVNVFIDEKFSFSLAIELALDLGLRPDFVVTPALLDEMLRRDGDARAYARALNFLSYRPRSSKEIRDKLVRDEFPETVVHRVLERLHLEGQVNDADFASLWVESRTHSRPKGARVLRQELRIKGVEAETIAHSLPDDEQELANAVEALRPQLRKWTALDERARRDKAFGFLQRRGFNFGVAKNALRVLDEEEEDNEPGV